MYLSSLMVLNPSSAFEALRGSQEEGLSFDCLLFLSSLEDCSCYGEVNFNLISPDEVLHPSLLSL